MTFVVLATLAILCLSLAKSVWLALRQWDAHKLPPDRWFARATTSVATIEETF